MRFARLACLAIVAHASAASAAVQAPEAYFGFKIGSDGELARYPKIVDYLQHLSRESDRVKFEELGKTTLGNPYVLATVSSPANLAKLPRLIEINKRLADPRGLAEAEAKKLAEEGRSFYFVYGSIHATEVGNTQALVEIAHTLATDQGPRTREILDNVVVLLIPSQNPDGQVMVIDHWYKTKGTQLNRVFPDLYHKYVGHDNNRDWFMFTQKETRLAIDVHRRFKPHITHDMHQQGPLDSRIFVPPFDDPYDPNMHPILRQEQAQIGIAMASALVAAGKTGVLTNDRYDLWAPARQYMIYHGQPRILTEIASANLADPFVNPAGKDKPLGRQEVRWNFPLPYTKSDWRLGQIVDYGYTVVFAALEHMAKYRTTWLENFYRVHRDWVGYQEGPYAFVVPAGQRDPFAAYEMLDILQFGEVELHRARTSFTAAGKSYAAGSWVIKMAQPYGAFAKTMLERQDYPDLRLYPGGPPKAPYDVTGHTLGWLMGVDVEKIDAPFQADLELVKNVEPFAAPLPKPGAAYVVGPESYAAFRALPKLQRAGVPVFRAAEPFQAGGRSFAPGSFVIPSAGGRVLDEVARATGLQVAAVDRVPNVDGLRLKAPTRIGLWKAANNMPAGWLMWLFEQYGFEHKTIAARDLTGDPKALYDVIVLPSGTSKDRIVKGLDPQTHDKEWEWAYGVGEEGWARLGQWVRNGGTLVAIGSAVETARELLDLPIEKVLPQSAGRRFARAQRREVAASREDAERTLREAFQSPARLLGLLRDGVADPESLFYCPGSLLWNEFDTRHPVAWGMPERWPVFFESDQAYRLKPGFETRPEVVARYPAAGAVLASGWLLGESYLRDQANMIAFRVGRGSVVTLGSQVDYRTQPRATFKPLFNAIFNGPATPVGASVLARLGS